MELNKFVIDVCVGEMITDPETGNEKPGAKMLSYIVVAEDALKALEKFMEEGSKELYYEGEPVNNIIVGLQPFQV